MALLISTAPNIGRISAILTSLVSFLRSHVSRLTHDFSLFTRFLLFFNKKFVGTRNSPTFALQFSTQQVMSKVCQITGKKTIVGNNVSHSNRRTKRTFQPNIHTKRFFLESEKKWITLKLTTSGMRTINKIGLGEALKRAKEKGFIK